MAILQQPGESGCVGDIYPVASGYGRDGVGGNHRGPYILVGVTISAQDIHGHGRPYHHG